MAETQGPQGRRCPGQGGPHPAGQWRASGHAPLGKLGHALSRLTTAREPPVSSKYCNVGGSLAVPHISFLWGIWVHVPSRPPPVKIIFCGKKRAEQLP